MTYPDFIKSTKFTFNFHSCDLPACPHRDFRLCCPEMEQIPSWGKYKGKDFNEVALYIMLMYDKKAYEKGTKMHDKFSEFKKRLTMAVECSGIDEKTIKLIREGDEKGADQKYITLIVDFLKYQNSRLWTLICAAENSFHEYTQIIMSKQSLFNNDKDLLAAYSGKEKIREFLHKVAIDLDSYYDKFYNGDEEGQEIIQKKIRFTPESISRNI